MEVIEPPTPNVDNTIVEDSLISNDSDCSSEHEDKAMEQEIKSLLKEISQ
jgi:hypothetical protein